MLVPTAALSKQFDTAFYEGLRRFLAIQP